MNLHYYHDVLPLLVKASSLLIAFTGAAAKEQQ